MVAEKTIDTKVPVRKEETALARSETREPTRYIVPAVDIYETADGLTLVADVPGVGKEGLDVKVEDSILTIRGRVDAKTHADATFQEFEMADYFRQFELSEVVDQAKISAQLRYGVLTLTLPKAEKAKPKKIDVRIG